MLCLTRRYRDRIFIGEGADRITITVLSIDRRGSVRLGVEAPRGVPIVRDDVKSGPRPAGEANGEKA
jgi:carbon storage regulator CsrA